MDRMRHANRILVVSAAAALVIALSLPAGCGEAVSARDLLQKSSAKMDRMTSARIEGVVKSVMPGFSTTGKLKIEEVTSDGGDLKVKYVMDIAGEKFEAYIIGRTLYANTGGSWIYMDVGDMAGSDSLMSWGPVGLGTLDELNEMLKNSTEEKIVSDDGGSYVISFRLKPGYLKEQMEKAEASAKNQGTAVSGQMKGLEDALVKVKVDKETGLVTEVTIDAELEFSGISAKVSETLRLVEYNIPLRIELPPEAKRAVEYDPGGMMTPRPSVPVK